MNASAQDPTQLLKEFTDIARALSLEKDHARLLELILKKAQELTHADGGTIYTVAEDKTLHFEMMITDSLGVHLGGTSKKAASFEPLPLIDDEEKPNLSMVATAAVNLKKTIKIDDAYQPSQYDFCGTREFDKSNHYHSQSFLTVPMTNHLDEVIGVLQLINAKNRQTGAVVAFSSLDQNLVESLASQAAVILTNRNLIDAQKAMFDALIQLVANAIDEKSPYTGGHCRRVPVLTRLLADAACHVDKGPLKDFTMTEDEKYELDVAAWLHDCGKITTPVHVVDKATKLESIVDRVELIDLRFEILKRDAMLEAYKRSEDINSSPEISERLANTLKTLEEERQFIRQCNIGGEEMTEANKRRVDIIAKYQWQGPSSEVERLLSETERENLKISRGTLSNTERDIINRHVTVSQNMLEALPYPKGLKRVPQIAGSHHEKVDGTGYPHGLNKNTLLLEARMVAIADVFEALTASDRPYKKAMPLSKALKILGRMKQEGHIDPDLFDVFMHEKIYLTYAQEFLPPELIDDVDITTIPGYEPLKG